MALTRLEAERSVSVIFLLPGEAEAGRSVLGISCSQEWRSPGWRLEDPSRTCEYKSFKEWRSPGWKIRLGDFLLSGVALTVEAGGSVSDLRI